MGSCAHSTYLNPAVTSISLNLGISDTSYLGIHLCFILKYTSLGVWDTSLLVTCVLNFLEVKHSLGSSLFPLCSYIMPEYTLFCCPAEPYKTTTTTTTTLVLPVGLEPRTLLCGILVAIPDPSEMLDLLQCSPFSSTIWGHTFIEEIYRASTD